VRVRLHGRGLRAKTLRESRLDHVKS
jgi:hypothetical protein